MLSHSAKKSWWGNHSLSQKTSESMKLMRKKRIPLFFVVGLFFTVSKKFVREPFCVSKKFRYGKISSIEDREGITILSKEVCLTSGNENFGMGTLLFSRKLLVSEKFFGSVQGGGVITILFSEIRIFSESLKKSDTAEIRARTYCFRMLLP